jgi:hypothetical protein
MYCTLRCSLKHAARLWTIVGFQAIDYCYIGSMANCRKPQRPCASGLCGCMHRGLLDAESDAEQYTVLNTGTAIEAKG